MSQLLFYLHIRLILALIELFNMNQLCNYLASPTIGIAVERAKSLRENYKQIR